ncbi:unnamed protein product [Ambrosiozyma monospora]|uniref:Unnamed protein product n=1 Tax=Ambrosiozyma monospora TaxID=43982 RepID=A0ACB5UAF6_AMBMO|nr:unnamed protein product [Ambrosiozyma monospora]
MNYFISNLPDPINENYSIACYKEKPDGYPNSISVFGYPHIIAIQTFYYKNRFISSIEKLYEKVMDLSPAFWKRYYRTNSGNATSDGTGNGKKSGTKRRGRKTFTERNKNMKPENDKIIDENVGLINVLPKWAETFDPMQEEPKLLNYDSMDSISVPPSTDESSKRKAEVIVSNEESPRKRPYVPVVGGGLNIPSDDPSIDLAKQFRDSTILVLRYSWAQLPTILHISQDG